MMTTNTNDIKNYLAGNKKGKDANKIEKEALKDPFLAEALEGYESFGENPNIAFDEIKSRLDAKKSLNTKSVSQSHAHKNRKSFLLWCLPMAAAVIGLIIFVVPSQNKIQVSDDLVISMEIIEPIDIFVPQDLNSKLQKNTAQKLGIATYIIADQDTLLITNKQSVVIDILMPSN